MTSFADLQTRVKNSILDLPTETEALVSDWINQAIKEAEEKYNFRHMEAKHSVTTTVGVQSLGNLPTDWKEFRDEPYILEDSKDRTPIKIAPSEAEMVRLYGEDINLDKGAPKYILETPTILEVYPFPDGKAEDSDGEYRIRIPYWAKTPKLVDGGDTNWWTDEGEWYLTYFATAQGFFHNFDRQNGTDWLLRAQAAFNELRSTDKRTKLPKRLTLGVRRDVNATIEQGRM